MRRTKSFLRFTIALLILAVPASSHADIFFDGQLGASFGTDNYSFVNSPSLFMSADATYGLTELFQLGVVYDHDFLGYANNGGNGSLNFWGGLVRVRTISGFFVDGQAGIVNRDNLSSSFSWGAGVGYAWPINYWMSLSPRVGYRSVPDSGITRSLVDASLMLSLRLF